MNAATQTHGIVTARRRPTEVETVQLSWANWSEVCEFIGLGLPDSTAQPAYQIQSGKEHDTCGEPGPEYIAFDAKTAHGETATFRHGDWIMRDSEPGTFYPVKPDVFAATYEVLS